MLERGDSTFLQPPPPPSCSRSTTVMLPRSQSIFHLGEEGGAPCHHGSLVDAAMTSRVREGLVVGLQILVHHQHQHHGGGSHHHHQHGRQAHAANIVLKQMVGPSPRAEARHGAVSCSFLKACSLCRRELSHNKDVYMYRGDQGFCSEECRWQQIRVDEAREREAIGKERRGLAHHHHHQSTRHTPILGGPRKTLLAVA